jgi:hypothetical protein
MFREAISRNSSPESRFRFLPVIRGKCWGIALKTGIDFFGMLLASKQYMVY